MEAMAGTTGTAKALGGWLVLGALVLAWIASGIGLKAPVSIDEPSDLTVPLVLLAGWLIGYLVVAALVVADAARLARRRELDALQRSANSVKVIAVGFFVLNFVALAEVVAIVGSDDSDRLGLDGILVALLFIVLTYLVLLPTSAYSVACLVLLRKDGRIGRVFFGVNLTLHFLFAVDVLATIVVVELARHLLGTSRPPGVVSRNLLAGVVIVGSLLSSVWFVLQAMYWLLDEYGSIVRNGTWVLNLVPPVEFVLLVLIPVVPLVTFRTAVRYFFAGDRDALRRSAWTVNLAMIPLFAQIIATCAYIVLAVTTFVSIYGSEGQPKPRNVAIIGAVTSIGLLPAVFCALLMLVPISIYGLTGLALRTRQQRV
jgi:hypothetical protein